MAITFLAGTNGVGISGGTSSFMDTTGAKLLVFSVGFFATITVSDSAGNTWTPLTKRTSAGGIQQQLFYVRNPTTAGSHSFTVSGTSVYTSFFVKAFADAAGAPTYASETGIGSASSSVTSLQPGSVTPTTNGSLIVSGIAIGDVQGSISADAGLSVLAYPGIAAFALAHGQGHLVQATAAALNPTWSWSVAAGAAASNAVFTPVAVERAQSYVWMPV